MNYITPIKTDLDAKMHIECISFLNQNNIYKSPRWFNVNTFYYATNTLKIQSTQNSGLFFTVDCNHMNIGYFDSSEFWKQFKDYRTDFLLANYPQIDVY